MSRTETLPGQPRRAAFTLVELLVAAAVCLVIMAILANVFQVGIDTMRQMRSAGEMTDQLRAAGEVMKRDLGFPHLLAEDNKPNQGMRLSDQRIDLLVDNGNSSY